MGATPVCECVLLVSGLNLSMVRQSLLVHSLILFWASQCSSSLAGNPSMARMTSPGHRLATEALLPGVTWKETQGEGFGHGSP